MKRLSFSVALLFCFGCAAPPAVQAQNVEVLTPPEIVQHQALIDLQWAASLSAAEIEQVEQGLLSDRDRIVEEAIKAVALHRLERFVPVLEQGVGKSYSFARILGELTAQALAQEAANVEVRLQRLTEAFLAEKTHHYRPLEDRVTGVLVIQKSKALRRGEDVAFAVPEALSPYHEMLLAYSAQPEDEAVASLLDQLAEAEVAGAEEYARLEVLDTYGRGAVAAGVQRLADPETVGTMSAYGRLLLLRALRANLRHITEPERRALSTLLTEPTLRASYFTGTPSLERTATLFEAELSESLRQN